VIVTTVARVSLWSIMLLFIIVGVIVVVFTSLLKANLWEGVQSSSSTLLVCKQNKKNSLPVNTKVEYICEFTMGMDCMIQLFSFLRI
jgi:hypothetical protein